MSEKDTEDQNGPKTEKSETDDRPTWAETYLLDTRFEGDAFVVIADIPGASQEEVSVGINHSTYKLVIKNDGKVLERVPLPWYPVEVTRAWYNNGILDARVRPTRS